MTDNTARQPKGIPTGGQFAAATHSEPDVALTPAPGLPVPLAGLLAQRDISKERAVRLQEQKESLDRMLQAQSVRVLASALLEKHPDAAVLRITENVDGNRNYDPVSLSSVDGRLLESADENDDWIYDEIGGNGPYIQDLVWDLDLDDDSWAAGLGTFSGNRKRDFRTVDIDLVAAKNAPLPHFPELHDPYERSFTADEQKALVDAAYEGVSELNDKLTERADDYGPEELAAIQAELDAATKVLHRADDI